MKGVVKFLTKYWQPGAPVVLACSGGPDSKALLYLLMGAKRFMELDVHVAHIDHGWRKESRAEAEALKSEVTGLGLKFHLRVLKDLPMKEVSAREGRYAELKQVASEIGAQATLLAHQMDDQAETVLKRVFEGATLPACKGMQEVSARDGMTLWRPLLNVSKKEIVAWLDKKGISYFVDKTNLDPKYLRGRMRASIMPFLEEQFGKSIVKNLCLLGKRAAQLEEHLNKSVCGDVVLEHFLKSRHPGLSREALSILAKKLKELELKV